MASSDTLPGRKLNFVLPKHLRAELDALASRENKSVAQIVREAIAEKVTAERRRRFDELMKQAYLDMAAENRKVSQEFEHADSENLWEWKEATRGRRADAR